MSIPIHTTTITVLRPNAADEPYETPAGASVAVATGVRAHISTSRGDEATAGGDQEVVFFRMSCDPIPADVGLDHFDQIQDEATGELYEVVWARYRRGLGLEHHEAGLRQVAGVTSRAVSAF